MVANPLIEIRGEHVGHAQAAPAGFIGVGWADAASGGTDYYPFRGSFKALSSAWWEG